MDYLDMKHALAKKGYTLTRVAVELGLFGPQSVQQVLTRKYISARVEKRVSEITGVPLEKLFPDRYQPVKPRSGYKRALKDCTQETIHEPRARKPPAPNR
jgi:lambda repressor-like predicted transcriptional regulator